MQKTGESNVETAQLSQNSNSTTESQPIQRVQSFSEESNDNTPLNEEKKCIVILCAVEDEWLNAEEVFGIQEVRSQTDLLRKYGFRYKHCKHNEQDIYIVRIQQTGMAPAASIAASAILAFRPKLIAMTGVCGGREDKTELGDIVVTTQTFDYEAGKIEKDKKRDRPKPKSISEDFRIAIAEINASIKELLPCIPSTKTQNTVGLRLKIHLGEMASGSSVVCNKDKINELTEKHDDVRGVDMEAYGVAYAADRMHTTWLVIKGIQDFGDGNKNKTEKFYRQCSAYASALLLQTYIDDEEFQEYL